MGLRIGTVFSKGLSCIWKQLVFTMVFHILLKTPVLLELTELGSDRGFGGVLYGSVAGARQPALGRRAKNRGHRAVRRRGPGLPLGGFIDRRSFDWDSRAEWAGLDILTKQWWSSIGADLITDAIFLDLVIRGSLVRDEDRPGVLIGSIIGSE